MDAGAERQHTLDTLLGGGIQIGSDHDAVFPEVNLTVHKGIGEVLHIRVSREGVLNGFALAQIGQLCLLIGALDMLYRFMELVGKGNIRQRLHGVIHAVSGAFGAVSAHDHFRVVEEIAVDGVAVLRLPQMHPIRVNLNGTIPLLQEDNVRHHFCTGVGFESGIGKPDGTQQIGSLGKVPTHGGILGVQGIAAGDERHHTAGTHLIQRFGKEVVVDVEAQLVVGWVINLVLPKGDIAHSKVKEIPAVCGFKACNGDIRLGIELFCNPSGDGIQFHTVQAAVAHFLREHTEEVAHTHGRLQNVAGLEAHISNRLIDGPDNRGTGVVRVEGGSAGGFIFCRGQGVFQLLILRCPAGFAVIKGIRQTAPAHIPGQNLLLLTACLPALGFNGFQGGDGVHIPAELDLGTAHTQILVHNSVVLGAGDGGITGRLRLLCAEGLHHNVIGKVILFAGVNCHGFGGHFRLNRLFFPLLNIPSDKGNGFRAEDGKAGGIGKGDILEVHGAKIQIHPVNKEGSAVDFKGGFTGNQVFSGKFLVRNPLGIRFCLPDNGSSIQLVRIHNLSVYDAVFRKLFPDGSGVNIVQTVIFFFRIEFFCLDKLGNPALHLCPGQHRFTINPGNGNPQRLTEVCAILTGKPRGGVPLPAVSFHIAHYGAFAVDAAIPFL